MEKIKNMYKSMSTSTKAVLFTVLTLLTVTLIITLSFMYPIFGVLFLMGSVILLIFGALTFLIYESFVSTINRRKW